MTTTATFVFLSLTVPPSGSPQFCQVDDMAPPPGADAFQKRPCRGGRIRTAGPHYAFLFLLFFFSRLFFWFLFVSFFLLGTPPRRHILGKSEGGIAFLAPSFARELAKTPSNCGCCNVETKVQGMLIRATKKGAPC